MRVGLGLPPTPSTASDADFYLAENGLAQMYYFLGSMGYMWIRYSDSTSNYATSFRMLDMMHPTTNYHIQLIIHTAAFIRPTFLNTYDFTFCQAAIGAPTQHITNSFSSSSHDINVTSTSSSSTTNNTVRWAATIIHPYETTRRRGYIVPRKLESLSRARSRFVSATVDYAMQIAQPQSLRCRRLELSRVRTVTQRITKYQGRGYMITNLPLTRGEWHYAYLHDYGQDIIQRLSGTRPVQSYLVFAVIH
jgi:hypothetical protein